MAGNTKTLRSRIRSVSSTLQLTKAMELVAASKIRRANDTLSGARAYEAALENAMQLFVSNRDAFSEPYFEVRGSGRIRLIVIAGDRGLAGGYNANVFRLAKEYPEAVIYPIGKRACERFGGSILSSEYFSFDKALELSSQLCRDFKDGEYDRLGILYTRYHSVMTQEAVIKWVLPLEKSERSELVSTIYEPDLSSVLAGAILEYVAGMIAICVRESFASEVAARRMAMDSAGKNAKEMIDELQLQYNRARQGAITQEITEIVAGSGSN